MSESDEDFVCLQVSNKDFYETQSAYYGLDIVDKDPGNGEGSMVSLENNSEATFEIHENCVIAIPGSRIIYGDVEIEDISDDEDERNG